MDKFSLPTLVILGFACYRCAYLVSMDTITDPFRAWIGKRASSSKLWKFFADLVHCPYCVGVWIAPLMLLYFVHPLAQLAVFTISIAGMQLAIQKATHLFSQIELSEIQPVEDQPLDQEA